MDVNVIVTCHNREEYWPHLKKILLSFTLIKPIIALCYNGIESNFSSDIKIENRGKELGEFDLISSGYNSLRSNGVSRWLKLCVDCWPADEMKIVEVFYRMAAFKHHFSGFKWDHNGEIATDVFFCDSFFMEKFFTGNMNIKIEKYAQKIVEQCGSWVPLSGRGKYAREAPGRWLDSDHGITMSHDIKENVRFVNSYGAK